MAATGAQLMALQGLEGELRHDLELSQDEVSPSGFFKAIRMSLSLHYSANVQLRCLGDL